MVSRSKQKPGQGKYYYTGKSCQFAQIYLWKH